MQVTQQFKSQVKLFFFLVKSLDGLKNAEGPKSLSTHSERVGGIILLGLYHFEYRWA